MPDLSLIGLALAVAYVVYRVLGAPKSTSTTRWDDTPEGRAQADRRKRRT